MVPVCMQAGLPLPPCAAGCVAGGACPVVPPTHVPKPSPQMTFTLQAHQPHLLVTGRTCHRHSSYIHVHVYSPLSYIIIHPHMYKHAGVYTQHLHVVNGTHTQNSSSQHTGSVLRYFIITIKSGMFSVSSVLSVCGWFMILQVHVHVYVCKSMHTGDLQYYVAYSFSFVEKNMQINGCVSDRVQKSTMMILYQGKYCKATIFFVQAISMQNCIWIFTLNHEVSILRGPVSVWELCTFPQCLCVKLTFHKEDFPRTCQTNALVLQ